MAASSARQWPGLSPREWSWSAAADGLPWTFKMRKDVQWVQYDPATEKVTKHRPVTAHDVDHGVKRTINHETASDYAYVNYIIKNAEAVNTGESTDLDSIGVRAVDDYTVEFTLEQAAGYFSGIAGMWSNRAQLKEPIEAGGDQYTEPGSIWTNGAYMLSVWGHENRIVMVKNLHQYEAKSVSIETINWAMVGDRSCPSRQEFVEAAHMIGARGLRIIVRHILPDIVGVILVAITLKIPAYITTKVFLCSMGLGVDPPTPSWGSMISDGSRAMRSFPNQVLFPSIALAITMFSLNLLGEGLRDALDPRMKGAS